MFREDILYRAEHDHVGLAFSETGVGEPALMFIHGNSCNRSIFAAQFEHFAQFRRVVAVDLRGHGQSGAPHQDYTYAGFADDCAWLCTQLGIQQVLLIGHSMGGGIALEIAARFPHLSAAAVALDSTLHFAPRQDSALRLHHLGPLCGVDYLSEFRRFFDAMFLPKDNPAVKSKVWNIMSRTEQHVIISLLEQLNHWPGVEGRNINTPVLYIGANQWRTKPGTILQNIPHARVEQLPQTGHFLPLLQPENVNTLVEDFFAREGL